MSIIFISHKLNEVLEIADRITRAAARQDVETVPARGRDRGEARRLMVGREVLLRVEKAPAQPGEPLLERRGPARRATSAGIEKVRDVSFEVRAGEIVGIAGVDGNGQTRADRRDHRAAPADGGRVVVGGKDVTRRDAREHARRPGVGHIPEDRQRRGLVLDFSLAENLALHDYRDEPDSRFGWLYPEPARRAGAALIGSSTCAAAARRRRAGALSGGNQQKVVLAREIDRDPRVLIAAQPTRGLDVGAIEFVHRRLSRSATRAGRSCSSRSSSRRSSRSPTASSSSSRARSSASTAPTSTEEELGLAMTGGRSRRAQARRRAPEALVAAADAGASAPRRGASASGSRSGSARAGSSRRSSTTLARLPVGGLVVLATGPRPAHDLQGDLQRHGPELALPWVSATTAATRRSTSSRR